MLEMPGDILRFLDPVEIASSLDVTPPQKEILEQINQKVAAASDLDSVMNFLFENTRNLFPCDRIGMAFIEDQGRRVVSRWVRADYAPVLLGNGYSEGLTGSSLQEILDSGKLRIISDLEAYLRFRPSSSASALLVKEGVRSSMTCPLLVDGRRVGLLFRSSRRKNAYDLQQAALHSHIAERLSQAVEKAYRIDQLSAVNRAYMEMLAFAAHELKSPLASLIMDAELLAKGYLGTLDERQTKKLHSIIGKAKGLLDTTKEYLDLARIEGGQLKLKSKVGLSLASEVIKPVLESLTPQIEEKKAKISLATELEGITLRGDPELLKTLFLNLIGNAVKYGKGGGKIRIEARPKESAVVISVWNEGMGFPPSERGKLFKRFSRLSLPEHKGIKGTGVGLYIAWQIAHVHGGRLWARSEYGSWAEFLVELPLG